VRVWGMRLILIDVVGLVVKDHLCPVD
jgi:hypothetical protein